MLKIKTLLKESAIHGIGCFSKERVPKGTIIWQFVPEFDKEITEDGLSKLSDACREQVLKYAYLSKYTKNYVLCSDDARFFNHSEDNNVINIEVEGIQEGLDVAARDIEAGEELTYDYRTFEEDKLF